MSRIISIALLIGGIVLILYGLSAADSFGSDVSKFFTGSPTDEAIWMIIGGTIMAIAGLSGTVMPLKNK